MFFRFIRELYLWVYGIEFIYNCVDVRVLGVEDNKYVIDIAEVINKLESLDYVWEFSLL